MSRTPVHSAEEYVEQAYFFRACREHLADGEALQDILEQLDQEILSTARLPYAIQFMRDELRHSGNLADACARLPHYFTRFQCFVLAQAEADSSKFTFSQALLILEREADYRARGCTPAGVFIFEIEAISRNRLGYLDGLTAMELDALFDPPWVEFIQRVRSQLGTRELAELVFARSEFYVSERQREDPGYQPTFVPLFGEKEGKIARASRSRDSTHFFAALQRHLGYPEVPRPPKESPLHLQLEKIVRNVQRMEEKLKILEQEVRGQVDLAPFTVNKEGVAPIDRRLSKEDDASS